MFESLSAVLPFYDLFDESVSIHSFIHSVKWSFVVNFIIGLKNTLHFLEEFCHFTFYFKM